MKLFQLFVFVKKKFYICSVKYYVFDNKLQVS